MDRIIDSGANYKTYQGLPPLAGMATIQDAMRRGLTVDECVCRLKRFHYAFKRLHEILNNQIPSEPIYELKMAFSLHSYLCSEHAASLRKRVGEMREPPLGLNKVPDAHLETFFDEIRNAPTTGERLVGTYAIAIPALYEAMERHIADTNPLADQPSVRVCKFALVELEELINYGKDAVAAVVGSGAAGAMVEWKRLLSNLLKKAGTLDGTTDAEVSESEIVPLYAARDYAFDGGVRRDERFYDPYNMGVNAEVYLYDREFDDASKVLMMFYKRLREIDVPEMMASIIAETPDKPWDYYVDMSRQLWDEARHAMMGEVGFISLGIDWSKVPVNFTWSLGLNTQLTPIERHAVLYYIEQGLMPKSGKRREWEIGVASKNPLSGLFQDYDWADEVLHSHIGRRWYISDRESPQEAVAYGDACWSKVLMGWKEWRDQGLTEHRNWWPEIYKEACEKAGFDPDPKQLAYNVSYETQRPDLKTIPAE
jgi:hypothetical protein